MVLLAVLQVGHGLSVRNAHKWLANIWKRNNSGPYVDERYRLMGSDLSEFFCCQSHQPRLPRLKSLIPTMEVQYRIFFYIAACILIVAAARMFLKLIRDFTSVRRESWARDLFIGLSFIVLIILLEAPYWRMDVRTPYEFLIVCTLFISFLLVGLLFHFGGVRTSIALARRRRGVMTLIGGLLIVILLGNVVILLGFGLNWNNNWTQYEWMSMTEKQIATTNWAAGIDVVRYQPLSAIPSGNITLTLSHVRQWDQEAAFTKMKNQIGVNWLNTGRFRYNLLSWERVLGCSNHGSLFEYGLD